MPNYYKLYDGLIWSLKQRGVLNSPKLEQAFRKYPRYYFLPQDLVHQAHIDAPIHIAEGQTASQPYTIAFMLELLNVQPGNFVLEIGYGSGWQTALLSYLVGKQGVVFATEVRESLCKFGARNIERFRLENVFLFCKNVFDLVPEMSGFCKVVSHPAASDYSSVALAPLEQSLVYPKDGGAQLMEALEAMCKRGGVMFDRIIAGAAFSEQDILKLQMLLAPDGIAVIPSQDNSILRIEHAADGFRVTRHPGFVFVKGVK